MAGISDEAHAVTPSGSVDARQTGLNWWLPDDCGQKPTSADNACFGKGALPLSKARPMSNEEAQTVYSAPDHPPIYARTR